MPKVPNSKASVEATGVDPKAAAAIERSVKGKEQAPTTLEQSGSFVDWRAVRDALGQPFDFDRIPYRKLNQMRRDPMFAFGLHYRKAQLVNAEYHVDARDKDGPNPQVAAFLFEAWKKIHARYIFQHSTDFEVGHAGMAKRFMLGNPGGVYIDPLEENPESRVKPVWDEGTIDPIIWKPFVLLPPTRIGPIFNNNGEFDGINYDTTNLPSGPDNIPGRNSTVGRAGSGDKNRIIDVYHALWATNDKDSVYGSIYGYPLLAHGYRYWWSYWFLWANLDRAFERMAVPPMLAYHPPGEWQDPEDPSVTRPYWEMALEAAERLRSNAVAAVPSDLATAGLEERGSSQRQWEFKFIDVPTQSFDALNTHLSYLDVMKLRSVWVPEQAFIEGEGGSSSRNVAEQMGEIFNASQKNKWEEIADTINRFIFPQLLAVNFPEFVNNGGTAQIVGHGFRKEDTEFNKQIIQLLGQADPNNLKSVDIDETLRQIGTPLRSPVELAQEEARLIKESQQIAPPFVEPQPGQVGTVPNPNVNPGFTNGGSVPEPNAAATAGFTDQPAYIYTSMPDPIILSEHDDFLANLPQTGHYADKTMRALAVRMRKLWLGTLRQMYPDFAQWLTTQKVELSDVSTLEDAKDILEIEALLADNNQREAAEKLADRLLKRWTMGSTRLAQLTRSSYEILDKMVDRAVKVVKKDKGFNVEIAAEQWEDWLTKQTARLVKSVDATTKANLRSLLVNDIVEGKSTNEIADNIRSHFTEFPSWRADQIARSEAKDAFNAGTLIVAQQSGVRYVRAKDAQLGPTDKHCEDRNGKLLTVREAWKQMAPGNTHPRDTLEFEPLVRATFSIETVAELPDAAPEDALAFYDKDSDTAMILAEAPVEQTDQWISMLADSFMKER